MRRKPGTDTKFPAQFAGNWLSVPGFAPRDMLPVRRAPKRLSTRACNAPVFLLMPLAAIGHWAALLRVVLHVEIAREPFASRAALQAYRFLVGHAPAQRDQVVVPFVLG